MVHFVVSDYLYHMWSNSNMVLCEIYVKLKWTIFILVNMNMKLKYDAVGPTTWPLPFSFVLHIGLIFSQF